MIGPHDGKPAIHPPLTACVLLIAAGLVAFVAASLLQWALPASAV
jgi:hypothetical protein